MFSHTDARRISVALACLSFALGVAGIGVLFLVARWYRIRRQTKRHERVVATEQQRNQRTPSERNGSDVERQAQNGVLESGHGHARSISVRSNVSRLPGEVEMLGRNSPVSPMVD
jgi:Flp pilus assembly protein TadB